MRTGSVKKYVIPNIPYLFVLWACLKLGTAYRLAAGADFPHKLMGLGQTVGPAFANLAPGLDPFDWLVGIVGAVGFRLLIYFKNKNAKKFRRDEEFGSARWGGPKDIAPFVDPVFENNVILTGTELLTMNTRPKNPANARNLNACVIGSSGSGKTRFWLTPQLLQASAKKKGGCSFVVVDPKGGVLSQVGAFLQRRGYRIKVFNSIDFSQSMHYNPLAYIRNEADILKFVDTLIANTKGEGKEGDPFWTKAETLLYCALIAYIIFEGPAEDRNMNTLVDMISGMEVKEDNENFMNAVDYMFKGLEKRKPDCFAVKQYKKYKLASGKTAKSILISCGSRLAPFDIPQLSAGKTNRPRQQNTDEQNYQHMERYCFRVLLDYYRLLCRWKEDYAPQTPEDGYHPHFVEALQKLSLIAYLLDELLGGDMQARASVVIEYGEEVRKLEQRMAELAAADEAADQNAGGQYSIADEH